jgi:hypothetical protein
MRNACQILFSKPEGMRIFGGHVHRWTDNIEIDLKDIECENVAGIRAVQVRD